MEKVNSIAHIECNTTGFYSVYTNDDFPFGFFGEGKTIEEAKADFIATFNAFRNDYKKRTGKNIDADFKFVMDVSALLRQYKEIINMRALSATTGISTVMLSQYASGTRHPKPAQRQRIIAGIHDMGRRCLAAE